MDTFEALLNDIDRDELLSLKEILEELLINVRFKRFQGFWEFSFFQQK